MTVTYYPKTVRSFCQTPHKLMNRVTATLTLTLTLTDTGGAVLTLMLGYRSPANRKLYEDIYLAYIFINLCGV